MATKNIYPKPFVKSTTSYKKPIMPRIMVNNQFYHQHQQQQYPQDNPTSTVHKSLVSGAQSYGSASYSRLILPTISQQGSLSPQSSIELVQQRNQQQQQHQPHRTYNQQHQNITQHQHEPQQQFNGAGFGGSPLSPASAMSGSHLQQQFKSGSSPSTNNCMRPESAAPTAEADYKQLLARISPSSPRLSAGAASNVLLPDDKRADYMHDKQLERLSIAHQTYRTTPIVLPKPKARHDLAKGSYMHLNKDPTWDMLERNNQHEQHLSKLDNSVKLNQACKIYPNDVIRSPPTSSLHNMNDPTKYVNSRAAKIEQQPAASQNKSAKDYPVPVFDYRQYINATRHAR